MALSVTRLKNAIDTEMAALVPEYASSDSRDAIKEGMFKAIAQAIVDEIQNHASISGLDSNNDTHNALVIT